MVHALYEAQRVLHPNGIILDLRPAPVHRRVGIQSEAGYREVGVMRENLEDDYAANRAVKQVLRGGLFNSERYVQFNCNRVLDSLNEFRLWLADFEERGRIPAQVQLLDRVERAYPTIPGRKKIIVSAPLMLRRLRNLGG
ncbi:MAG TPA: hypothetical protein VFR47_06150 [Anaerolineales bacterium]|nr:hypothetical protein [Anaerolineales bacterium]